MGRPSKRARAWPAILAALRAGSTRTAAAEAAGIHPTTFHRWLCSESAQNAVRQAEAQAVVFHVATIRRAAERGSWAASAWWLERRHREDWGRTDRLVVDLHVRQEVERMAGELGLDPAALLQEAERIASRLALPAPHEGDAADEPR